MTQDNWIQEGLSIQTERQQEQKEDTYQHYDNEHYETRHLQLMQTEAALQDQTPSSLDTPELALYWQTSPPPETDFDNSLIHCNVLENNITRNLYQNLLVVHDEEHYQYHFHQNDLVMSDLAPDIYYIHTSANTNANINNTDTTESSLQQQTLLMQPIYDSFHRNTRQLAGLLLGTLRWDHLVNDILLTTTSSTPNNGAIPNGMMAVVENTCGSSAIYKYQTTTANGKNKLVNLRQGAKQDDSQPLLSIPSKYRTMGITASFHHYHGDHQQHVTTSMAASSNSTTFHDSRNNPNHKDDCHYSLHFYPSQTMEDAFRSHTPKYAALLLALVFIAFAMVFGVYVHMIQQRYQKIQALAIKASTVISSLFPANVRDRIMESALLPKSSSRSRNKKKDSSRQRGARITDEKIESIVDQKQALSLLSSSSNSPTTSSTDDPAAVMNGDRASSEHLKMLKANAVQSNIYSTKPIADLFPEATGKLFMATDIDRLSGFFGNWCLL